MEVLSDKQLYKRLPFNQMLEIYKKLRQCRECIIEPKHVEEAICDKLQYMCNSRSNKPKMGIVDATSLVMMDKNEINCIISFDGHFDDLADYYMRIYNTDLIDQKFLRSRKRRH